MFGVGTKVWNEGSPYNGQKEYIPQLSGGEIWHAQYPQDSQCIQSRESMTLQGWLPDVEGENNQKDPIPQLSGGRIWHDQYLENS